MRTKPTSPTHLTMDSRGSSQGGPGPTGSRDAGGREGSGTTSVSSPPFGTLATLTRFLNLLYGTPHVSTITVCYMINVCDLI